MKSDLPFGILLKWIFSVKFSRFFLFVFLIFFGLKANDAAAQALLGQDHASNYDAWTTGSNAGFGFGAWNLYDNGGGNAGHFMGSSTTDGHGQINTAGDVSFGMFAHSGEGVFSNAERTLNIWDAGYSFHIDMAINWRDGARGLSLFSSEGFSPADELWNFNVSDAGYGPTAWDFYSDMILRFQVEQAGGDLLISVHGSSAASGWEDTYTTTLPDAVLGGFRLYTGGHSLDDDGQRNLMFNNLLIVDSDTDALLGSDIMPRVLIIPVGMVFNAGNQTITFPSQGLFVNDGDFNAGTSLLIFTGPAEIAGDSFTAFANVTLNAGNGQGVNFGDGLSAVQDVLRIQSGFVDTHAPFLPENSTLFYAVEGPYQRAIEWNNPYHVQLGFNTQLDLNLLGWNNNLTLGGDFIIDENSSAVVDEGHEFDVIVEGSLLLNGSLTLSSHVESNVRVKGSWLQSGTFSPNGSTVFFEAIEECFFSPIGSFDKIVVNNTGGDVVLLDNLQVQVELLIEPLASLNLSDKTLFGSGDFTLSAEAVLKTGHPQGISSDVETGALQMTGAVNLSEAASYHYIGEVNQVIGNALPSPLLGELIVNPADNALLYNNKNATQEIHAPGALIIRSGTLVEPAQLGEGRSISGNGNLIMSGGRYLIAYTTTEWSSILFPRLTGDYSGISGGVIELAGTDNFQRLRGGRNYHDLTFSAAGTKIISTATPNINGTVSITDNAVVNTQNFEFGKGETRLSMDSGRLISHRSGVFPLMEAYNITGGTIEFANHSATTQTVRGTADAQYFNVDITGTNVANSNGNIHILEDGTFTIREDALFRIGSNRNIQGEGSFMMGKNSTLLYGAPDGISASGNTGNIRVNGLRLFTGDAAYGFIGAQNQQSGTGLPLLVKDIIMDKDNEALKVTLSQPLDVWNSLSLNKGVLASDGHEFRLLNANSDALVAGPDNDSFLHSYVEGNFSRAVVYIPNPYLFPVGENGRVQTASVRFEQGPTGSGNFLTATYSTDIPDGFYGNLPIEVHGILVNTISEEGYWIIKADGEFDASIYDVELFAKGFENILYPELMRIIKRDDNQSAWEEVGKNSSFSGTEWDYRFTLEKISGGFSEFALGSTFENNPLPVQWNSFYGFQDDEGIRLLWETATEINNSHFTVLRSQDGMQYTSLGVLNGAGTTIHSKNYVFVDSQPLGGINYYKIQQTDFDGKTDFSNILAVQYSSEQKLQIYYAQGALKILSTQDYHQDWHYRVYDLSGHLLLSGVEAIAPFSEHSIFLDELNSKILLVSLWNDDNYFSQKIFVP